MSTGGQVFSVTSPFGINDDFYGIGSSGLLFGNSSGEADTWELNGTAVIGGGSIGNPGPSWRAVGSGFNDGGASGIALSSGI